MTVFSYLCSPKIKKQLGEIMSNEIINQNADEREVAHAPAATTKSPVNNNMEEQTNNDLKPSVNAVTQKEESKPAVTELPTSSDERDSFNNFNKAQEPVATGESQQTEVQIHDAVLASPHDDFDWSC